VSHISIRREHHATLASAKKVADKVAAKLATEYDLRSNWEGDVLHFDRSGLHGTLAVTAKDMQVDVKLGFLMAAFKGPIQAAMEKQLDTLIKPAAKALIPEPPAAKKPAAKAKK
jgi:putative polyhydroxyalkanoate system protein